VNIYRGYGTGKIWSSYGLAYHTCLMWCVIYTLHRPILEPVAKASHAMASELVKVLGNLRTIFMKLMQVLLA
jgi:hypothetical protein